MSQEFDHFFCDFMNAAFGYKIPAPKFLATDWTALPAKTVESDSNHFQVAGLFDIRAWATKRSDAADAARWDQQQTWAAEIAEEARSLTPETIQAQFKITRTRYDEDDFASDIWNCKINHGYWEQHFMLHSDGYDEELMRPTARRGFHDSYYTSRFEQALLESVRRVSAVEDGALRFSGMEFGFAFHSGGWWHDDWMNQSNWQRNPHFAKVAKGTYAGGRLFFRELAGDHPVVLADGAFPKQTLLTGELVDVTRAMADRSDTVVFCVPPHLEKARLKDVEQAKQTTLLVSGRFVHHAWAPTLAGVAKPLLERLARGETVTILVQAGVFSALLACYLKAAKAALNLPGRTYYLDLGQAIDVVTPDTGGNWIGNKAGSDALAGIQNPFELAG